MMKLTLNPGTGTAAEIFSGPGIFHEIQNFITARLPVTDKVFILVDENTRRCCLPVLADNVPVLEDSEIIEIRSGEKNKSIRSAEFLWTVLTGKNATRSSLLVNLGGGMVTDLGGFVASTFKRGISFIHIPTTLIGMADASIGGKTAINLGNFKNQVGSFQNPEAVFVHPGFLSSLDTYELLSGLAEILKIALVADPILWDKLLALTLHQLMKIPVDEKVWEELINASIENKCRIVREDFRDRNLRRVLNFGHTVGHAFESLSLTKNRKPISHGHAIALGILCEAHLSVMKTGLKEKDMEDILRLVLGEYEYILLDEKETRFIISCIRQDKKLTFKELRMPLLEDAGKAISGVICSESEIRDSLDFYRSIKI